MNCVFNELISKTIGIPYFLSICIIGILGIFFFLILPLSKKIKSDNYLPFLLLILVLFYENFGHYLNLDKAFNQKIHEWLFDVPFQGWNIWSYNMFNFHLSKILFLIIVLLHVKRKIFRKIIGGFIISFLAISIGLQWSGIEVVHGIMTTIYFLGNFFLIAACGLFFIDLVTSDYYLEYNPLKMWSFWFITLTLFQVSAAFLSEVSHQYLAFHNVSLYDSLAGISQFLYLLIMATIVLKLADEALNFSKKNLFQHA